MSEEKEQDERRGDGPSIDDTTRSFAAGMQWAAEHPEEADQKEAESRARFLALIDERLTPGERLPPTDRALFDEAARRLEAALSRSLTAEERNRIAQGPVKGFTDARERDRFEQRMVEECRTPEEARRFLKDYYDLDAE